MIAAVAERLALPINMFRHRIYNVKQYTSPPAC